MGRVGLAGGSWWIEMERDEVERYGIEQWGETGPVCLYGTVWHGRVWYGIILCGVVWCGMI